MRWFGQSPKPQPAPRVQPKIEPKVAAPRTPPNTGQRAYQLAYEGAPGALSYASQTLADSQVHTGQQRKRASSRQEIQNGGHMAGFVLSAQKAIVGTGLRFKSMHKSEVIAKQIEDAWIKWGKSPARNGDSWWLTEWMAVSSLIADGEIILHIAPDRRRGVVVRLIEPSTLATNYSLDKHDGTIINMGIERRDWEPIAYWFYSWRERPATQGAGYTTGHCTRVPANEIIYVNWRNLVGMTRGMPYTTASLNLIEQTRHYIESELIAARQGTRRHGFITSTAEENLRDNAKEDMFGSEGSEDGDEDGEDEVDEGSNKPRSPLELNRDLYQGFRGGQGGVEYSTRIDQLAPGEQFQSDNWQHPNQVAPDFTGMLLRGVGAGLGTPYHKIAGDLSGINFSAGRIGEIDVQMTWLVLREMLVEGLHQKVFQQWVESASLLGWFDGLVDDAREARWIGPGFPHIQPREQAVANDLAVKLGIKTRSEIIRESGREPKEVFQELADEQKQMRDLGLSVSDETEPDDPDDDPDDGDEDPDDNSGEDANGNNAKSASVLSSREVRDAIRAEHAAGASYSELARSYGVGRTPLTKVLTGMTFKRD